jgi:hypothetical protein
MDAFAKAGLTHVLVDSQARTFADCLREIELYAPVTR